MSVKNRNAVRNTPPAAASAYNLAVADFKDGNLSRALRRCRAALREQSRFGPAHHLMGLLLFNSGRHDQALVHLEDAARLMPDSEAVALAMAKILSILGRTQEALHCYRRALELTPDSVAVLNQYGEFLRQRGRPQEAMTLFSRALKLDGKNVETLRCAGNAFNELGMSDKALSCYRIALHEDPGNATLHPSMGNAHMAVGDRAAATASFRSALEIDPDLVSAHLGLMSVGEDETCEADLEFLRRRAGGNLPVHDRVDLRFALARGYARCGRHDEAFEAFVAANALRDDTGGGRFDMDGFARETAARIDVLDRDFFARRTGWGVRTGKPVFVVGMPRSGTTLVESILGSHPACHMGGELSLLEEVRLGLEGTGANRRDAADLPALWRALDADAMSAAGRRYAEAVETLAPDAARVVDKMPHNFVNLWLVALMLPDARIIHCRRNPLDTCVSIFTQVFRKSHAYKNDLRTLGLYYRKYLELMAHWTRVLPVPMHEIHYEDLVADQEDTSRRLVEFCGLDWDPACLDFHHGSRTVLTASSLQVKKRMYNTSIDRWKRYAKHLGPLMEGLGMEGG